MAKFTDVIPGLLPEHECMDDVSDISDELQSLQSLPDAPKPEQARVSFECDNEDLGKRPLTGKRVTIEDDNKDPGKTRLTGKRFTMEVNRVFSESHGLPSNLRRGSRAWLGAVKSLPQIGLSTVESKGKGLQGKLVDHLMAVEEKGGKEESAEVPMGRDLSMEREGQGNFMESFQAECDALLRRVSDHHFGEVRHLVMQLQALELEMKILEADNARLCKQNKHLSSGTEKLLNPEEERVFSAPAGDGQKIKEAAVLTKFVPSDGATVLDNQVGGFESQAETVRSVQPFCLGPESDAQADDKEFEDVEPFELWPSWTQREDRETASRGAARSKKMG